ncbi:N-alpha-acetyltransferase 15, NatA auxiliary subunit, putative [Plasmodium knowlesi strain H]|uniref:N-alpha-acetyltransferase 15, NatA auxiliary subunit, putative n=3 Tax=Plasmodium knowlesi TaxID=5850 RepID=A0A5K1UKR6_PLAKH|nr:uncharacterized protein PKNH_1463400 [Plasmodium knowlesi strain H]OTN64278.1 putative N-alpha-acetyltransferase 15 - NatA auxiliary subunit [Plasmodium knowlesi]CAA9991231.1 N-alpha-acetyltransferase 15, NatA auxiliary subunit, putative [Plasmodium knowlesi strain H]SBO26304.1 N-alpha-acetyltransferase 15, NatA auxiliary subunit, putative [Plasmodium knowlesi strain H]SBO29568.1 N-alpha-acetyltransferase 15, NatA auxiliary subunit, putative [Plasmodium knowlesi strain H]VVS80705.1 N-alpha-|eukprot:XP_002262513.1 [Plasmodium knowlesi strain H]
MKKDAGDDNKLPNKEMNNFRLMTQLIELKKNKKAFKICEQILKKYPKNGETLAVKGYLLNLIDEKNKDEAFKLMKEGIVNNISSSFCWYLYGCLYKIYKNNDEALKCYLKAVKLNRYDYKALKEACVLLLYLGKYEQFKDLRINVYNDTAKGVRDKAILIFAFHLLKQYEKCSMIINQVEDQLGSGASGNQETMKGSDLTPSEKHDLIIYMCEIMFEGKLYKECLDLLKAHEEELLDKLWYNKILGLVYLYQENFHQANLHFRKAFELNYENLNILLLILYTEKSYTLDGGGNSGQLNDQSKQEKTLSSLFFLDYKNKHKMDTQVNVEGNVKVLLHEFILDVYGSNRNMKFLSRKEKNIFNDYVCHNWGFKKYDVYTLCEFHNFVNINSVKKEHFIENLHLKNIDEYINSMKESVERERSRISEGDDVYSYNIIHWSEKLGVDIQYCYKKKFEKGMNMIHFLKIKNLNIEEENSLENYFRNLQKKYKHSNLLKIFPLYFYNEQKFSVHVEKLLRSLCFQKCLTIFSYFKPFFTYKNIKIILFLLHKYIENYEKVQDIPSINCGPASGEIGGCEDCLASEVGQEGEESLRKETQGWTKEAGEKREFISENDNKENHINGEAINEEAHSGDEKINPEKRRNGETEETAQMSSVKKVMDNFLDETEEMKNIIGMATPLGGGENPEKKEENAKKVERGSGKKSIDEGKEKKEIKLDLKKLTLTEEERKEYFILCIYSFISQLYDYINCAKESLTLLKDISNKITFKKNESVKQELVFIKGLIYKRNGNYLEAYRHLEECRLANIGDRYINTKTIITCLKCGLIKDAKKMASIFTNPLDNNFMKNINETQCFWLEYNISQSYFNNHPNIHLGKYLSLGPDRLYDFGGVQGAENQSGSENIVNEENKSEEATNGSKHNPSGEKPKLNLQKSILVDNDMLGRNEFNDYSKGLHYLHMGHKQFLDIQEDQICFYYYTIRKLLYRSYRHMLYLTSEIFSCRSYRKFGKALIKALLHIHDSGLLKKNDLNKKNKKKSKTTSVANQDENDIYEHIKNNPLENAMIYMKTFLSQPNVDLSVYRLKFDIERRSPDKDYGCMIDTLLTMKSIFPHHNYNYKFGPAISYYLCTVHLDSVSEEQRKEISNKLNDLLGLNHSEYNTDLLKEVRKKYMEDFVKFFKDHKKGDLRYYQSALEMYLDCGEKIDEGLLEKENIDPKKNKLTRCFKFLRFLIKCQKMHVELAPLLDHFKICCKEAFPLATAFQ